jgi:hypothetical protein
MENKTFGIDMMIQNLIIQILVIGLLYLLTEITIWTNGPTTGSGIAGTENVGCSSVLVVLVITVNHPFIFMGNDDNTTSVFNIKIATWNCNGFKSCADYAQQLAESHHITFICEHWLLPCELSAIQDVYHNQEKIAFLQSSVDPLVSLRGRPYGGIGFLCDNSVGLTYKYENCDSERICALKVYKSQCHILTLFGVYLPYEKNTTEQMECYMDNLDKLQGLVNGSDPNVPVIILGDMNTMLPQSETLTTNWYKQCPFFTKKFFAL